MESCWFCSEKQNRFTEGLEVDLKGNKMHMLTTFTICVAQMKKENGETWMGKELQEEKEKQKKQGSLKYLKEKSRYRKGKRNPNSI